MKTITKRLELKRETVRALVMKTGLRTGDAVPDLNNELHKTAGSVCCVTNTNSVSGNGGGRIGVGASDSKMGGTVITPSGGQVFAPDA